MKIETIQITPGVSFGTAQEIPCSTARPGAKQVGHASSGNGVRKPRKVCGDTAWERSRSASDERKADHDLTAANRMVMILVNGKRRFAREVDYRAGTW
jgi:hypothetical protein